MPEPPEEKFVNQKDAAALRNLQFHVRSCGACQALNPEICEAGQKLLAETMPDLGDQFVNESYLELARTTKAGLCIGLGADPLTVFFIVGALQLATRHPHLDGKSRDAVQGFIDSMIEVFRDKVGLATTALLEAGNDPTQDVNHAAKNVVH